MLKMTGVDHVVLHVRDLARAKRFYLDVLGMTVEHETSWQCFMHCGRQGVALFEVKDRDFRAGHDLNHKGAMDGGASWLGHQPGGVWLQLVGRFAA